MLAVGLAAGLVVAMAAPAFAWTLGLVDSSDLDTAAALAVSHSDHVWIAWQHQNTDDLYWSSWSGSAWKTTQVAGVGTSTNCHPGTPAPGFAQDGTARIASACNHQDGTAGTIRWTYYSTTSKKWVTNDVAPIPLGGSGPCTGTATSVHLAFAPDTGLPGIAFGSEGNETLYWLHYTGSAWASEAVAQAGTYCTPFGPSGTLAYDPLTKQPAIAWTPNISGDLMFSERDATSGTWTTVTVPNTANAINTPWLQFAPDGTAWVGFGQGLSTTRLKVAKRSGSTWTVSTVDPTTQMGFGLSLALKGSLPRIAYYDYKNGNLRFASLTGSTWSSSVVASANNVGANPSLGFSSTGVSYIAYTDLTNKDIRWARPG